MSKKGEKDWRTNCFWTYLLLQGQQGTWGTGGRPKRWTSEQWSWILHRSLVWRICRTWALHRRPRYLSLWWDRYANLRCVKPSGLLPDRSKCLSISGIGGSPKKPFSELSVVLGWALSNLPWLIFPQWHGPYRSCYLLKKCNIYYYLIISTDP